MLKPFKWPHPIILNLPNNLLSILDSPVPIIVGRFISNVIGNEFKGIN